MKQLILVFNENIKKGTLLGTHKKAQNHKHMNNNHLQNKRRVPSRPQKASHLFEELFLVLHRFICAIYSFTSFVYLTILIFN